MGVLRPFPIVGGSYTDDALSWAHQDTVNYLPVRAEREGTRSPSKLAMVPGMRVFGANGSTPHRGGRDVEGTIYVVIGTTLYRIASTGAGTSLGTIPGTGRVQMTHNQITGGNQIFIATGSSGYVYNTYTSVLSQVTNIAFPGAKSCDFLGQYIIGVEPFGRYWFHSALVDATDYNSLDVFQAETSPDRIVGLIASHNEVLIFGERTIEPWSNNPSANAAFQLQVGSVIETGCGSGDTICRLDNSVFFLTDKGQVAKLEGYTPRIISTYAMEGAIRECNLSRAFAFTWEDKGHTVYYLTFPDGKTWGYDVRQGEWHRRESYGHDRWRLNTLFKSNGLWYGGDFQNGNMYVLDWDWALDGCDEIERYRTGTYVHDHGERVTVNALQVAMNCGGVESVCVPLPPVPWLAIKQGGSGSLEASPDGYDWTGSPYSPSVGASLLAPNGATRAVESGGAVLVVSVAAVTGTGWAYRDPAGTWHPLNLASSISASSGRVVKTATHWVITGQGGATCQIASDGINYTNMGVTAIDAVAVGTSLVTVRNIGSSYSFGLTRFASDGTGATALPNWTNGFYNYGGAAELATNGTDILMAQVEYTPNRVRLFKSTNVGSSWTTGAVPFPDFASVINSPLVHYSAGLGLYFVIAKNRIAYGATIESISLDSHVLAFDATGIDDDGQKIIVCGGSGGMEAWSPVIGWQTLTGVAGSMLDMLALGVVQ